MKAQIEVVYFMGCPNAAFVLETLKKNGISFGISIQDRLPSDSPKRALTSPSILVNGAQVLGSSAALGSQGCTWSEISSESILRSVRDALTGEER